MKFSIFLLLLSVTITFAQITLYKAKFTVRVVGENKEPLEGVKLKIFSYSDIKTDEAIILWGKTNIEGVYTYKGDTWRAISFEVEKKNYYGYWAAAGMKIDNVKDGKLLPYGQEFTVILPKVINPVPMYAVEQLRTELPQAEPTGFDLEQRDWVLPESKRVKPDPEVERMIRLDGEIVPRGLGVKTDLLFSVERTGDDKVGTSKVKLTFPNPGDGVIPLTELPESGILRKAPAGGYLPEFVWADEWKHFERDSDGTQWREERKKRLEQYPSGTYYYFRVRTVLNGKGEVVSALYGKMLGFPQVDAWGKTKTARINLGYYLNPDGTRNLEFDPGKNLFKDLPDFQRPILP